MKPGEIIFEGETYKGAQLTVRYPKQSDAPAMLKYINTLITERTFIRLQEGQLTLQEEQAYLKSQLEQIRKKSGVLLLGFQEKKLVSISGIEMRDATQSHVGGFGLSVSQDTRGTGIGKKMMELVLSEGRKHVKALKIIHLEVHSANTAARKLYKKIGFKEYGKLPRGIKHRGRYVDDILMYKEVKK